MSGHSKWSQIKRKKEIKDKEKGNIFSKLSRLITLAVIEGGGITDPVHNVKLRLAIDKARSSNMPKENIKRAIEKGIGPEKSLLKEIVYEGFGPHGASLMILTTTDNPNRTLSEIRSELEKHGGKLGTSGSVSYLFQRCGVISFPKSQNQEEDVFLFAQNINASDIDEDETSFIVYFPFENLGRVGNFLGSLKATPAEINFKPISLIKIEKEEEAKKIQELIEALEGLDDVQRVFSNFALN